MREDHLESIIAQAIGQENAQKAVEAITKEWGDSLQRIPLGTKRSRERTAKREAKRMEMRHLHQIGLGIDEIAERFGCCQRTVLRAVKEVN